MPLHLMKMCPQCGTLNDMTAKECQLCGAKFPKPEKQMKQPGQKKGGKP